MNTYGYHITNDSIAAHHAWVFPRRTRAAIAATDLRPRKDSS